MKPKPKPRSDIYGDYAFALIAYCRMTNHRARKALIKRLRQDKSFHREVTPFKATPFGLRRMIEYVVLNDLYRPEFIDCSYDRRRAARVTGPDSKDPDSVWIEHTDPKENTGEWSWHIHSLIRELQRNLDPLLNAKAPKVRKTPRLESNS